MMDGAGIGERQKKRKKREKANRRYPVDSPAAFI